MNAVKEAKRNVLAQILGDIESCQYAIGNRLVLYRHEREPKSAYTQRKKQQDKRVRKNKKLKKAYKLIKNVVKSIPQE